MKTQDQKKKSKVEEPKQVIETFTTPDEWKEVIDFLGIPVDSIFSVDVTDIIAFTALRLKDLEGRCTCQTKKSPKKK